MGVQLIEVLRSSPLKAALGSILTTVGSQEPQDGATNFRAMIIPLYLRSLSLSAFFPCNSSACISRKSLADPLQSFESTLNPSLEGLN